MTGSHPIETIDCMTLDEFWNVVSPIGEHFGQPNSKFIFRGHGNSKWALVPKVFRPEVIKKYKRGMWSTLNDYPGHTVFEWSLETSIKAVSRGQTKLPSR
jgi:hypothetical protein